MRDIENILPMKTRIISNPFKKQILNSQTLMLKLKKNLVNLKGYSQHNPNSKSFKKNKNKKALNE